VCTQRQTARHYNTHTTTVNCGRLDLKRYELKQDTLTPHEMELDQEILTFLAEGGGAVVADSVAWAEQRGHDHQAVVGALKSLEAESYVVSTANTTEHWQLTGEAAGYVEKGSPEAQLYHALPDGGVDDNGLDALFTKEFVAIAKGKCMQKKWIVKDKASGLYMRNVRRVQWLAILMSIDCDAVAWNGNTDQRAAYVLRDCRAGGVDRARRARGAAESGRGGLAHGRQGRQGAREATADRESVRALRG
jgi:hypothetical protein